MADRDAPGPAVVALVGLGRRLALQSELAEMQLALDSGAVLRLVSWAPPSSHLTPLLDDVVVLGPRGASASPGAPITGGASSPTGRPAHAAAPSSPSAPPLPLGVAARPSLTRPAPRHLRVLRVVVNAVRSPGRYVRRARQLLRQRTRRSPLVARTRRLAGRPWALLLAKAHTTVATVAALRSPRAQAVLDAADVLVALDLPSVLVVRAAARRRPQVPAVLGLATARARLRDGTPEVSAAGEAGTRAG